MRQITKSVKAFNNRENFKMQNTEITNSNRETKMYLFGNLIAVRNANDDLYVSNAGYPTMTTKERLNGLNRVHVVQKKGQWYLNGQKWDGSLTKIS